MVFRSWRSKVLCPARDLFAETEFIDPTIEVVSSALCAINRANLGCRRTWASNGFVGCGADNIAIQAEVQIGTTPDERYMVPGIGRYLRWMCNNIGSTRVINDA